eukprot:3777135-Heterocapsa_arctica.AAC.1
MYVHTYRLLRQGPPTCTSPPRSTSGRGSRTCPRQPHHYGQFPDKSLGKINIMFSFFSIEIVFGLFEVQRLSERALAITIGLATNI